MLKIDGALNEESFWQPGVFRSEHLVNMAQHDYHLEPNVRFSPDKKLVIFTSNMFGPSYVFGVEVNKSDESSRFGIAIYSRTREEIQSTRTPQRQCAGPGTNRNPALKQRILSREDSEQWKILA